MPTYEYQCEKCGSHLEVDQRMTDDPLKIHNDCGGSLVKVFSSVGIVWKGAGFYKTDTRSTTKSSKKEKSEKNSSDSKTGSSASSASPKTNDKSASDKKSSQDKKA